MHNGDLFHANLSFLLFITFQVVDRNVVIIVLGELCRVICGYSLSRELHDLLGDLIDVPCGGLVLVLIIIDSHDFFVFIVLRVSNCRLFLFFLLLFGDIERESTQIAQWVS
jgi:hypothetical protein